MPETFSLIHAGHLQLALRPACQFDCDNLVISSTIPSITDDNLVLDACARQV